MKLFQKSAANLALSLNLLIGAFAVQFPLMLAGIFFHHDFIFVFYAAHLFFIMTVALLTYQMDFHPLLTILYLTLFLFPKIGLIIFLIVFFKAKEQLRLNNYSIGFFGAKPVCPPEDPTVEIDRLIREGKISTTSRPNQTDLME